MLNNCPPVLFLVFNRPDLAERVFARIRDARPAQLFVAADGPRHDREGEAQLCEKSRRVIDNIDWPCAVKTLFREENLGCRKAVSSAITWFFENVEEGIVLEDDCVPDITFFRFCAELLERYRDDERIALIGGRNNCGKWKDDKVSYFFTFGDVWGWASWRRAWIHYHENVDLKNATKRIPKLNQHTSTIITEILKRCKDIEAGRLDSWAYQWALCRILGNGLAVTPAVNLVENIGFGSNATHTLTAPSIQDNRAYGVKFPLIHPKRVKIDNTYYEHIEKKKQKSPRAAYSRYIRAYWKDELKHPVFEAVIVIIKYPSLIKTFTSALAKKLFVN